MSNISYCRFRNTLADLRDCLDNMDDGLAESPEENQARVLLIALCVKIGIEYGDES